MCKQLGKFLEQSKIALVMENINEEYDDKNIVNYKYEHIMVRVYGNRKYTGIKYEGTRNYCFKLSTRTWKLIS